MFCRMNEPGKIGVLHRLPAKTATLSPSAMITATNGKNLGRLIGHEKTRTPIDTTGHLEKSPSPCLKKPAGPCKPALRLTLS